MAIKIVVFFTSVQRFPTDVVGGKNLVPIDVVAGLSECPLWRSQISINCLFLPDAVHDIDQYCLLLQCNNVLWYVIHYAMVHTKIQATLYAVRSVLCYNICDMLLCYVLYYMIFYLLCCMPCCMINCMLNSIMWPSGTLFWSSEYFRDIWDIEKLSNVRQSIWVLLRTRLSWNSDFPLVEIKIPTRDSFETTKSMVVKIKIKKI